MALPTARPLPAGKKVKGRKRHLLVDEGFPLRLVVHSAGLQDSDGARSCSTACAGASRDSS